jgi:hypothetical protein
LIAFWSSSIAPTREKITETKETESVPNTPRGSNSGFSTASIVVGKVKLGDLTSKLNKGMEDDVIKTEESPKSVTPRCLTPISSGHKSLNVQKAKEPASPSISRKLSPFTMKKRPIRTGLHAFKSKGTKKKTARNYFSI